MFIFIHVINLISNLIIQNKLQVEDTEQNNVLLELKFHKSSFNMHISMTWQVNFMSVM